MNLEIATLFITIPLLLLLWKSFYRTGHINNINNINNVIGLIGCILTTMMVMSWYLISHINYDDNFVTPFAVCSFSVFLTIAMIGYWINYSKLRNTEYIITAQLADKNPERLDICKST